ncbi:hypothetical protein JCM9279_007272 [Rhodotorula babjevae]
MSALDHALLRVDTAAPVRVDMLASLPPALLAVASLRPDLDVFLRQRAHVEFLMRRSRYRKSDKRDSHEQPLLDHPLDFALPDSPLSLTPAELVLVQFNRRCTSLEWADEAADLFLSRASEAQAADERAQARCWAVRRCEMVCDGGAWVDEQGVTLEVEPDALVVGRAGEVPFKVGAFDMTGVRRFAGRRGAGDEVDREGFEVEAQQVVLDNAGVTVTNVKLTFELARAGENGELLAAVASWSRTGGFQVGPRGEPNGQQGGSPMTSATPRPPPPPSPPPPRRARRSRSSSRRENPSDIISPWATSGSRAIGGRQGQQDRSDESRKMERDGEGPWAYVDDVPEAADWHPGELSRQIALLRAIAPDLPLAFVTFSLDDLALLSRRSHYASLPRLPANPPDVAPGVKHVAVERLGLEHIYRAGERLNLSAERLVLLTAAYPALQHYARQSSKLIGARDALVAAYARVLGSFARREAEEHEAGAGESFRRLFGIVRSMEGSAAYRRQVLYGADGRLVRSAAQTLSEADVGSDVYARFEGVLAEIVRDEERAGSIG